MEANDSEQLLDETARVVVLGDPGVGKTSLIIAATESFDPRPPACLPPTRLPPSFENVPVLAIDTSSRSETRQSIENWIEGADVVLLCYAVDMPDSIRHLRTHWLPEFRRLNCTLPIILCGCRMDVAPDQQTFENQRKFLEELLKEFREVEMAIECSAKSLNFVQEAFHFALKAVVHPQFPLYDTANQRLKPRCSQALRRIFLLCDRDNDNKLDEIELNDFQVKCFDSPLQPDELAGVIETVKGKLPTGVYGNALTESGFLFLHALFMERGRYETTWTVLRKFGYTNELTLTDDLFDEVPFDHPHDKVLQLSDKVIEFLTDWFLNIDEQKTKTVLESELYNQMEKTSPEKIWTGPQWERLLFSVAPVGHMTLQGFLSKWNYFMLLDPKSCLKQILYLGFNNDMIPSMYTLSKHRRQERRESLTRSIIQCWVFGSKGCGKSTFLKALVGPDEMQKVQENNGINEGDDYIAVDVVSLNNNSSKTLVLHEANPAQTEQLLDDSETTEGVHLESIDVAVFLYSADNAKSFLEAKRLMLEVSETAGDHLPCLLICTKSELDLHQETIRNMNSTCEELKLREPISISAKTGELHSIYKTIINAALKPSVDMVPETSARKHVRIRRLWTRRLLTVGLMGTTAALVAIYLWPKWKSRNSTTKEVTEITK